MHPNLSNILNKTTTGIIGMVHVGALPGTPFHTQSVQKLVEQTTLEAKQLEDAGFDAIIVENMHDAPYVHGEELGPEIVSGMTRVAHAVINAVNIPVGVQILSGGNKHAIAVADAVGGSFIRCENFVFSHVADEGLLTKAEAGGLLRYRKSIGAEHVKVFCDIKKKHASHAITADIDIAEFAHAGEFFGADGFVVTGLSTGKPTDLEDVKAVRAATILPVLVGSGVTPENAITLSEYADALIVGSWMKQDGFWKNAVDPLRASKIIESMRG
ncbi:MAG: BtpA/SgcQ family protein [Phycisphaerales bacterium]|nr:BtpA/SgcQ family protein [Phycisphaerales bacterium]